MNSDEFLRLAKAAGWPSMPIDEQVKLFRFALAVKNEALEAAAKVCDSVNNFDNPMTAGDCANEIRRLKPINAVTRVEGFE